MGYLPQDVELFEGSVAVNIAHFDLQATPCEGSGGSASRRRP
jgi:ABC-type protease/lipase transport system fused ATPase/permease subunit